MKYNKKSNKWLTTLVLLLSICVSITSIIYLDCLTNFLPSDVGALPIYANEDLNQNQLDEQKPIANSNNENKELGFVVYDDNGTWEMQSTIEIFKISYENGEKVITVASDNEDKVIAPGTKNSYTFKLKNTSNVAMDYDLQVKTSVSPNNLEIPLEGKINRFDGKWIFGNKENYDVMNGFEMMSDSFTLGAGKFSYYTLDWQWPFDGNDELDTYLGDLSADEEIVYTIEIHTVATASVDSNDDGGIQSTPNTGDNSQILLYAIIGGVAFILILILIIKLKDEDEKDEKKLD